MESEETAVTTVAETLADEPRPERTSSGRALELTQLADRPIVCPQVLRGARLALLGRPADFQLVGQSPFWRQLSQQVRREVMARGGTFQLSLVGETRDSKFSDELRPEFVDDLSAGRLQGVVALGLTAANAADIEASGVPMVGFATECRWTVNVDSRQLMKLGVQALMARGCGRIGFWQPSQRRFGGSDAGFLPFQVENFRSVLNEFNLPYVPSLVRAGDLEHGPALFSAGVTLEEEGYFTALKVLGKGVEPRPDGLLILDDMVTRGALAGIRYLGANLAGTVQVATSVNKGLALPANLTAGLIQLQLDGAEIARLLLEKLESLVLGVEPAEPISWVQSKLLNA